MPMSGCRKALLWSRSREADLQLALQYTLTYKPKRARWPSKCTCAVEKQANYSFKHSILALFTQFLLGPGVQIDG